MKLSVLIKTIKGVTGKAIIIFVRQMLAILVTLLFALGGGALTGLLMMCVARIQNSYNKQQNSAANHLALNTTQSIVYPEDLPKEQLFDDAFFFQEEEDDVPPPAPISPLPTVYVSGPPLETNNNNKGFVP